MADTKPVQSANLPGSGTQLLKYAGLAIAGLIGLVYLLGFAQQQFTPTNEISSAIDYDSNSITLILSEEPPQMDSTRGTDAVSFMLLGHIMEGLLRYDPENNLAPGVAYEWELRDDGASFKLREDAYWSNGEPVTAKDFVFSWRRTVDPNTASQYAFIVSPVKNASAITQGDLPIERLGVTAVGDYELEVVFERPTPYFLGLMAFPTFFPINEAFFDSTDGGYASDAEDMIYNGPFVMSHWAHDASIRFDKNAAYWNRNAVHLDTINFGYILRDSKARINLFDTGQIASAGLDAESLDLAMTNRWNIKQHNDGSVYFMEINHREDRATRNWHLRRALQLVNDPNELVNKVIKVPGNLPAYSIFPVWVRGAETTFREEHPAPEHKPDIALAKKHLALALEELGLSEPPTLSLLSGDNPASHKQSEYYQNVFQDRLGIPIRIDRQIFKQRLAKMTTGDFDIVLAGWGPDYDDALTFGDLFASWNENNRGRYASDIVDEAVRIAQSSTDPYVRMEAFAVVQEQLYKDVAILLNYERGSLYVQDPRLGGVNRRAVGTDPDYSFAYLIADPQS